MRRKNEYFMVSRQPECEEEPITEIIFDTNECKDYNSISKIGYYPDLIKIVDSRVEEVEVNAAKLYEALTKSIKEDWFKPNQNTLNTMADILRKEGFHVS